MSENFAHTTLICVLRLTHSNLQSTFCKQNLSCPRVQFIIAKVVSRRKPVFPRIPSSSACTHSVISKINGAEQEGSTSQIPMLEHERRNAAID